jgi:hypothetical protein
MIKHGWMKNPPFIDEFIDDCPIKTSIWLGDFHAIAMFEYQSRPW